MKSVCFGWVTFCFSVATLGCRPPSAEWNGRWKLSPSKSSFHGPILTISISADGEYNFDDGSLTFTFRCDGKDRPIGKGRTRSCVKSSATVLDLTQKESGVKTTASHWELSAKGEVFMATGTAFRPSGPVTTAQMVALRISGSNGFAGQWRNTSYLQRNADLVLRLDSKTLHLSYPITGQYVDAPLDGVDAPMHAPDATAAWTYSARLVGPREILTLTKHNGKPFTQGSLELSYDVGEL